MSPLLPSSASSELIFVYSALMYSYTYHVPPPMYSSSSIFCVFCSHVFCANFPDPNPNPLSQLTLSLAVDEPLPTPPSPAEHEPVLPSPCYAFKPNVTMSNSSRRSPSMQLRYYHFSSTCLFQRTLSITLTLSLTLFLTIHVTISLPHLNWPHLMSISLPHQLVPPNVHLHYPISTGLSLNHHLDSTVPMFLSLSLSLSRF